MLLSWLLSWQEFQETGRYATAQDLDQWLTSWGTYAEGHITEETAITQSDKSSDMAVKIRQIKLGKGGGGLRDLDTSNLKISDAY